MFELTSYSARVLIPTYPGIVVIETKATDADSPENSQLEYSVVTGNEDGKFHMDSQTGVVTIQDSSALLDTYELVVRVTDGVYESACHVMVSVDESRDSGLVFTRSEYTAHVMENSTAIEKVTVVQVRGHELNEHVTFTILNPDNMFQIGDTSGVIESTGVAFDREAQVRDSELCSLVLKEINIKL